jgi:uncharacterized protein
VLYLDSSAIVKLIVVEAESAALGRFIVDSDGLATCGLARVEVSRAVRSLDAERLAQARAVLRGLGVIGLDDTLLTSAADLEDPRLRTLDAIHVAAAASLGEDLDAIVTYDHRMAAAARTVGLPVASPA